MFDRRQSFAYRIRLEVLRGLVRKRRFEHHEIEAGQVLLMSLRLRETAL